MSPRLWFLLDEDCHFVNAIGIRLVSSNGTVSALSVGACQECPVHSCAHRFQCRQCNGGFHLPSAQHGQCGDHRDQYTRRVNVRRYLVEEQCNGGSAGGGCVRCSHAGQCPSMRLTDAKAARGLAAAGKLRYVVPLPCQIGCIANESRIWKEWLFQMLWPVGLVNQGLIQPSTLNLDSGHGSWDGGCGDEFADGAQKRFREA